MKLQLIAYQLRFDGDDTEQFPDDAPLEMFATLQLAQAAANGHRQSAYLNDDLPDLEWSSSTPWGTPTKGTMLRWAAKFSVEDDAEIAVYVYQVAIQGGRAMDQATFIAAVAAECKSRWTALTEFPDEYETVTEYLLDTGEITTATSIDDAVRAVDAHMAGPF